MPDIGSRWQSAVAERQWLRIAVAALGVLETCMVAVIVVIGVLASSDPAGDAMAAGFAFFAGVAGALFIVPALLMAYHNRFLWYGLALVVVPLLPVIAMFS